MTEGRRRSKKERFLRYMMDRHREWVVNSELTHLFGWSFNQRKNELQREAGIKFETKQGKDEGEVFYRLLTDPWLINPEACKLRTHEDKHPLSLGDEFDRKSKPKGISHSEPTMQLGLNF